MSAEEQVRLDNFDSIFSLDGKVAVVTGGSRGLGLLVRKCFLLMFDKLGVAAT
ncbi:hypothetical protein KXX53_006260, partial [Aspergillus fumigatus]